MPELSRPTYLFCPLLKYIKYAWTFPAAIADAQVYTEPELFVKFTWLKFTETLLECPIRFQPCATEIFLLVPDSTVSVMNEI